MVVVVVGPDGSGKTAVAGALAGQRLPAPVLHLHHRPGLLPARTVHVGPVTEPHRPRPYPTVLSSLKVLYLWVDYLIGWMVRIRPIVRTGGSVVIERGWWDLLVDPRRYRLAPVPRLLHALGRLLPRPDATVVLHADLSVLLGRKQELPAAELARQQEAWLSIPDRALRRVLVDAAQPLDGVVLDVVRHLGVSTA